MNRLVGIGLAIAVAPAIVLLIGRTLGRQDIVTVSEARAAASGLTSSTRRRAC